MSDENELATNPEPQTEAAVVNPAQAAASGDQESAVTLDATPANEQEAQEATGPISLARIRELRKSQEMLAKTQVNAKPPRQDRAPQATEQAAGGEQGTGEGTSAGDRRPSGDRKRDDRRGKKGGRRDEGPAAGPVSTASKIAVPSRRAPLSADLEEELNAAMGSGGDLDKLLIGDSMLQIGHQLEEGQRVQATVVKVHGEHVFLALGGPNEGLIPKLQFEDSLPEVGAQFEVVVRGFLPQEGLYELTKPGNAVDVSDWSDLREGEVIEVLVTGANTGGLECKAGQIPGFIPASQIAEYRVENMADFVDQKVLCVVTEANPRRGNLVLSRRAVLEREKAEKREQRLASLEVGAAVEGIVRKILDFGAFIDIGGLDGLLHISQLSWERVKHPGEILTEGQKIQVRVDKIDPQTGKIGLSYRALQEHPWTGIEQRFPVGSLVSGTVTRIAEFGAFVRVSTGVEGLIHLSELAHHRVHRVSNVVQEGQAVEVKVLSVEPDKQRMSLSLKAAQAAPEVTTTEPEAVEEAPREPALPKHRGPLKGGYGGATGGEQFGLKW